MPLFVVSCTDQEGTVEKRLAIRPQHLARLQKLNDEGRLNFNIGARLNHPAYRNVKKEDYVSRIRSLIN